MPTIDPEGAETVPRTPDVRVATPLPVARFKSLPVVPEKRESSLSTEVAVLVEASPPVGGVTHVPSPLQKVEEEALVPLFRLATGRLPVTPVARDTFVMVLEDPEMVLLVSVCESVVPTTAPEGAATVERTPDDKVAMPEPVARFKVFPDVPEKRVSSLSTEVAVLVEASPPAVMFVQLPPLFLNCSVPALS